MQGLKEINNYKIKELVILPYSDKFPKMFKAIRSRICDIIGEDCDIYHIGSTAVPWLAGKGIIDIMIGINNWETAEGMVNKLKNKGFPHAHPKERGRIFLSNKRDTGFGDFHIHITIKDSEPYKEMLGFRDYLRKNKEEADKYSKLKTRLSKLVHCNRLKYKNLKDAYIKETLEDIMR